MKIGIMGCRGIPNQYGGFEQFAEYLSFGLLQKGHEVSVYNSSLHPYMRKEWKGVQIIHCKDWEKKIGPPGQFLYDLNCINDARKRNFDVFLHLGYTSDSIWHRRWPKKTINIVNMDGLEWQREKYGRITQRFLKWAEKLAAKKADVVIADSPLIKDHIFDNYGKEAVFISYGASIFENPDTSSLLKYHLHPHQYFLVIARMEPENNIETIVRGYLDAGHHFPLFIIGNINNKYGKRLTKNYRDTRIRFSLPVYDQTDLNNLRYYSALYFHGHSKGGTNPSLLEAMACYCRIAAHNNPFNKSVLEKDCDYFTDQYDVSYIIKDSKDEKLIQQWKKSNEEKIRTIYNTQNIIDKYEDLMLKAATWKV